MDYQYLKMDATDSETGLYLEGEEWLADWKPEMTYDEWEASRAKAAAILAPKFKKPVSPFPANARGES